MKHEFLRRLSALALALVMAVSLCVSPAWADDGDDTGSGDSGTTEPVPSDKVDIDTKLIILQNASSSWTLTAFDVAPGERIKWNAETGITVTDPTSNKSGQSIITEVPDDYTSKTYSVNISAQMDTEAKKITVNKCDADGKEISNGVECYVYCGNAPIHIPDIPNLTVGEEYTLNILPLNNVSAAVKEVLKSAEIRFTCSPTSYAQITPATVPYENDRFSTKIIAGNQTGLFNITMTLPGGYSHQWSNVRINPGAGSIPVTYLRFDNVPSTIPLIVGQTYTMPAPVISPSNATNKDIEWSVPTSSPSGVVSVSDKGVITAEKAGTATVKAKAVNGSTEPGVTTEVTFTVTVTDAPFSVELKPASDSYSTVLDLRTSTTQTVLEVQASGQNREQMKVTRWTTSNQNVAYLENPATTQERATIVGKSGGVATITAYISYPDANNVTRTTTATCTITVLDKNSIGATSVNLSETSHTMPADGTFKLAATVLPSNVLVKTVQWRSSNEDVATVDKDGNVKAKKQGETLIIAQAYGGLSNSCQVTVTPVSEVITLSRMPDLISDSPTSNKYSYIFRNGVNNSVNFTAVLTPTGAADPVHWVSKNPGIASVESSASKNTLAKITAVSPGKTTITAIPMDPAGKDRTLSSGPVEVTVTVSGLAIEDTDHHALSSLSLMENQRQEIQAQVYPSGDSSVDWTSYDPSIVTVNPKTGATTTLIGRAPGTTTVTARKGSYLATLTVTVMEDSAGIITASTTPGTAYQFSRLASQLQSACQSKTGAGLSYITNLSVSSTDQGILHDQHHSSSDTGAGVGIQDRYYPGTPPQGQRSLSDLSFVPRNDFNGVAEISYTAWSTNNKPVNGVIRITVNGTGDVMYASGEGSPVTFQADDFNHYHPNFKSVSFTPPLDSRGVLYYNYNSASQPGTKVTASDKYNRTGTPSVDRVTFVPAAGYSGTVTISYRGTDNGERSFTGTVTINVSAANNAGGTADISYPLREDSWVTFAPADFNAASQRTLGEALSYVRFTPTPSSEGTLFYNYRGFGNFDSMVNDTTSYYYSGTPALSGVSFVPTTTTPGQVDISYTGYTVKGNTFTGTIHIGQRDTAQPADGLRYSVVAGQRLNLSASAINSACVAATGASLSYIQFTQLPTVSQGTLRYTRQNSSTPSNVSTGTRFFYSGTGTSTELIGNVYFQAGTTIGTVTIPFTGYNTNNVSFTDEIVIQVTPPTTTYSGTTSSPLRLSASQISSALSGSLSGTLSYITFTSLPSTNAGRLYQGYNGVGTGTQVNTGTRYYVSGTPSIDQISFVPRGRYNGQVTIGYTATNTSGQSANGQIVFNISSTGSSRYFNDMAYHTWAAPSVDYLYQNNVTNGVTSTQFAPNQRINRCDFVLMLCRAFKFSGSSGSSFPDVPADSYFASAVAAAKQMGIVNGDDRGRFQPYGQVTRQDAMVMTYNALRAAGWSVGNAPTSVLNQFSDGNSVSSYARTAVSALVQMGAVNGDNGRLLPHNSITRAEAAVILHFVMTM